MLEQGIFAHLTDKRRAEGKRFKQEPLLCALVLAILAGATSLRKMEMFLNERLAEINALLGTSWKKAPSWVAISNFMMGVDIAELEKAVRKHAKKQSILPAGYQFIAIDGKALRGSVSPDMAARAKQLVSAFTQQDKIILGHVEVVDKSNEIPAVQELINALGTQGRVFTMDAMHCQKKL